ncbi:hypothetical protein [Absidia glauca]|uniref:Uncharacterized protein n=1 Tax=Absidia glauca TaxID=4829 RepID=A0A168SQV6_ABSGL|nr:hypothetical protein [Absidia glauca]
MKSSTSKIGMNGRHNKTKSQPGSPTIEYAKTPPPSHSLATVPEDGHTTATVTRCDNRYDLEIPPTNSEFGPQHSNGGRTVSLSSDQQPHRNKTISSPSPLLYSNTPQNGIRPLEAVTDLGKSFDSSESSTPRTSCIITEALYFWEAARYMEGIQGADPTKTANTARTTRAYLRETPSTNSSSTPTYTNNRVNPHISIISPSSPQHQLANPNPSYLNDSNHPTHHPSHQHALRSTAAASPPDKVFDRKSTDGANHADLWFEGRKRTLAKTWMLNSASGWIRRPEAEFEKWLIRTSIFFSTLDLGYDDDDDDNEDDDDDDDSPTALYHKIRLRCTAEVHYPFGLIPVSITTDAFETVSLLSPPPSPLLPSQRHYTTLVTLWQVTPAPTLGNIT